MSTETKGVTFPKTKLGKSKMDKICHAARKLFTEHGFYQTSITDICRESKTAVGTFYIYFEDKTALYRCLIDSVQSEIKDAIKDALQQKNCTTRLEKEKEGMRAFIKYGAGHPDMFEILWGSLTIDKSLLSDYYRAFGESYVRSLEEDKAELSQYAQTEVVAYMLMGINSFLTMFALNKKETSDEEIDHLIDFHIIPMMRSGLFNSECEAHPTADIRNFFEN